MCGLFLGSQLNFKVVARLTAHTGPIAESYSNEQRLIASMSLGPAGASLNPEQADNLEDVRPPDPMLSVLANEAPVGKAIRRQRSA